MNEPTGDGTLPGQCRYLGSNAHAFWAYTFIQHVFPAFP